MHNGLVENLSDSIKDTILKRIEETKELLIQARNKGTYSYVKVLIGLAYDYEQVSDFENAEKTARECLKLIYDENIQAHNSSELNQMIVSCYDTLARCGDFESFLIAVEWNRPIEKQFYLPRRRILKKYGLIQAFQDVIDGKLDFLCINMPPRTGKSTTGIFFCVFMACLYPDRSILGNGHSASLTQSFYNEVVNICTSEEYRLHDIFPTIKMVNKSAEYSYIDFNFEKRFHTMMFRSVDGGTTGLAEASNLLYCDDLVKDVETANNPDRLEKLFYTYTSTIQDRKVQRKGKDGVYRPCPEVHINTPWSIHDVTSRLIQIYGDDGKNPRVRIISVPCYDENGDSNFKYDYGKGFDVDYYKQLEASEDPVIFSAKYLMKPVERDGLVFNKDNVNFYNELPSDTPDRVVAYADVAHGGADYFSMPIAYIYGNEVFIEKVLFKHNFGGDDYIRPFIKNLIISNKVQRLGIEKNNGGDFFATLIQQDLKEAGYRCNITTHNAPTTKSKLDRILACQNEIKGIASENNTYRIYFKNPDLIKDDRDYLDALQNLYNWNQNPNMQSKQHDDFPDSLAGLIMNVLNGSYGGIAKSVNAIKYL